MSDFRILALGAMALLFAVYSASGDGHDGPKIRTGSTVESATARELTGEITGSIRTDAQQMPASRY